AGIVDLPAFDAWHLFHQLGGRVWIRGFRFSGRGFWRTIHRRWTLVSVNGIAIHSGMKLSKRLSKKSRSCHPADRMRRRPSEKGLQQYLSPGQRPISANFREITLT